MFDGDPQARVKDRDRDRAVYVIAAALRNRQISQADHDLRVERVRASQTVGDLEGLVRDIAAPPAPVPPTAVVPPVVVATSSTGVATAAPAANPYTPGSVRPAGVPSDLYGPPPTARKRTVAGKSGAGASGKTARSIVVGCFVMVAVFVFVPIVFGVVLFASQSGGPEFVDPDPEPAGPPFELTAAGLRDYVTTFEESFGDTEVVRAVFYDGYVVSWVPAGEGKVAIWNYVDGAFDQLGDPIDDTQEPEPVDLTDLRPAKVMSLVRTARQTLGVTDPNLSYVIFDRGFLDGEPQVSVYVSNDAGESGYLLADVDGNVLQTSKAG